MTVGEEAGKARSGVGNRARGRNADDVKAFGARVGGERGF